MNKKGVSWVLIGIVIVAVVVIGVVAYWAMTSTGGENGGENGGGNGGGEETPDVAGASSLEFKVSATIGEMEEEYVFQSKNLGTSEVMLRVEQLSGGSNFIYIMNQAEQKAWAAFEGEWTDVSDQFSLYWEDTWAPALESYQTELADWTGSGEWEYTVGDDSYKVYDIVVNPTLDDSLFTHTE
jgi:hypothetical protein